MSLGSRLVHIPQNSAKQIKNHFDWVSSKTTTNLFLHWVLLVKIQMTSSEGNTRKCSPCTVSAGCFLSAMAFDIEGCAGSIPTSFVTQLWRPLKFSLERELAQEIPSCLVFLVQLCHSIRYMNGVFSLHWCVQVDESKRVWATGRWGVWLSLTGLLRLSQGEKTMEG